MSEKVVEPAREAKAVGEYIAACHESWRAYHESKATGGEVDEIFGLPPILPLRVRWQCTAAVDETANGGSAGLTFASPTGLEGIASNCGMAFEVTSDGAGGSAVELAMTYDPSSPLARLAAPVLVVDNALALKFLLKRNMRGTGSE